MESFVGIDVSQRRLDVHETPGDDAFHVSRDADGIEALVRRLQALTPAIVALEASGGFETVVAAGLAAAKRDYREFRVCWGMMGWKEPLHASSQRTTHSGYPT
jgi:transposase